MSWSSLFCQNLSWSSGSCTWVWNWDTMCDHELREENKKVRNKFPKESVKKMEFTSWLNSFNLLSWWWSWCSLPLSWIHESPHASSSLLSFYIFNLKEFMIRGDTRERNPLATETNHLSLLFFSSSPVKLNHSRLLLWLILYPLRAKQADCLEMGEVISQSSAFQSRG